MHHKLPLDRIKASISTDWLLNTQEIEERRVQYGTNDIIEVRRNRWVVLMINTAKDPMIWFLVATSLLFCLLKNFYQALILILATIPLIGMDAFLHWRTQVSTQNLKSRLARTAEVIRDNKKIRILAQDIVPGDLVIVSTGEPIPADGILLDGEHLLVDESTLTGESFPVSKKIITSLSSNIDEPMIENTHWGFAGTRLLTGQAMIRIVYTGHETLYGEIVTSALQITAARTPLQKAIGKLIFTQITVAILICIILALVRFIQGFGWIDAILSAAVLAVAALPDEFPMVFTFFLGVGIYRLAIKKALVKRAVSVENIGRVTYICSDKTGTITEGYLKLVDYFPAEGFNQQQLLSLAAAAARFESGDVLDKAIFDAAEKFKIKHLEAIATFPFTEDRKKETNIVKLDAHQILIATKGAPETVLKHSTCCDNEKEIWLARINQLAASGYKIIACAQIIIPKASINIEPQKGYQFAGLLAFADPPRAGVKEAIRICQASGIHVLMITGDHPETASAIANEIGLSTGKPGILLGEEIKDHLGQNNRDFFRSIDVIARALPAQKLAVVTSLQSAHEIVAVTGDGVNDVPALKIADVGIAMGERGTQSAREVADIILLDDNFDSIVNAISEGRQLFKNLKLSFKYLLMIHIPFVISAAIIPLLGYPLLYYPIHVVFVELIIHPTCLLVFQDLPPSQKLDFTSRTAKISFFTRSDWLSILLVGGVTTSIIVISFILLFHVNQDAEHTRTVALGMLGFFSAVITAGLSRLSTLISRIITAATIIFTIVLIQIPIISKFVYLTPLHKSDWLLILVSSVATLLLVLTFSLNLQVSLSAEK